MNEYSEDFVVENDVLIKYIGKSSDVVIPDGVTEIRKNAFWQCRVLTSLMIPGSVARIENFTFSYCRTLTSVTISENVKEIGAGAFQFCPSLIDLKIPNTIERIKGYAFRNCSSLANVTIPGSVKYIEEFAFADCPNLKHITVPDSVKIYREGNQIFIMIGRKDYSVEMERSEKYPFLWNLFFSAPEEKLLVYMKEHFSEMFFYLIEEEQITAIQNVFAVGNLITEKNIDELIQYAIHHQKHEIYIMLTDYKYQHFEFQDPAEKLKL